MIDGLSGWGRPSLPIHLLCPSPTHNIHWRLVSSNDSRPFSSSLATSCSVQETVWRISALPPRPIQCLTLCEENETPSNCQNRPRFGNNHGIKSNQQGFSAQKIAIQLFAEELYAICRLPRPLKLPFSHFNPIPSRNSESKPDRLLALDSLSLLTCGVRFILGKREVGSAEGHQVVLFQGAPLLAQAQGLQSQGALKEIAGEPAVSK